MSAFLSRSEYLNGLLEDHRSRKTVFETNKLEFKGMDGYDVYNICNEFPFGGKAYIAGRVEKRDTEISEAVVFEKIADGVYAPTSTRLDMMQDPCQTVIDGELVIGGTKIYANADGRIDNWNTVFYKGKTLDGLKRFADAPFKMKDVRLLQTGGAIHVFTRPQGGAAKAGRIGYVSVDSSALLTTATMESAKLLEGQFDEYTWGGVNQAFALKNGKIGLLGHIAVMSEGDVRHYYGMTFCFDPETKECGKVGIICERSDFAEGAYKRKDLIDVVFVGGLVRLGDGTAELYVGLSDAEAHRAVIKDPFTEYEKA